MLLGRRELLLTSPPTLETAEPSTAGRLGPPAGRLRALVPLRNGTLVSGCRAGELQIWTGQALLRRTQVGEMGWRVGVRRGRIDVGGEGCGGDSDMTRSDGKGWKGRGV